MQPQNAPKGCLNRIGLSNTPAGPRCVRRAGGDARARARARAAGHCSYLARCPPAKGRSDAACDARARQPAAAAAAAAAAVAAQSGRAHGLRRPLCASICFMVPPWTGPPLTRPDARPCAAVWPRSAARRGAARVCGCVVCGMWCVCGVWRRRRRRPGRTSAITPATAAKARSILTIAPCCDTPLRRCQASLA